MRVRFDSDTPDLHPHRLQECCQHESIGAQSIADFNLESLGAAFLIRGQLAR